MINIRKESGGTGTIRMRVTTDIELWNGAVLFLECHIVVAEMITSDMGMFWLTIKFLVWTLRYSGIGGYLGIYW